MVPLIPSQKALEARAKELSEEEADIADQRIRFETERVVAFYEQLSTPDVNRQILSIPILEPPLTYQDSLGIQCRLSSKDF